MNKSEKKENKNRQTILPPEGSKCIDLTYLNKRTNSKPELMKEMIYLYLKQTPPLISRMRQSMYKKDAETLYTVMHKMIPSFSIMGINKDVENMAKKIQEVAGTQQNLDEVKELVFQVETICMQACEELKTEYEQIEISSHDERQKNTALSGR